MTKWAGRCDQVGGIGSGFLQGDATKRAGYLSPILGHCDQMGGRHRPTSCLRAYELSGAARRGLDKRPHNTVAKPQLLNATKRANRIFGVRLRVYRLGSNCDKTGGWRFGLTKGRCAQSETRPNGRSPSSDVGCGDGVNATKWAGKTTTKRLAS